jgi:dual specificity phosphatase 12
MIMALTNKDPSIFTLNRPSALKTANITHIVSVLRYDFKDYNDWEQFKHCSVQVDDVEDENLLGEFARSGKFIREGLESGGGVLVHW